MISKKYNETYPEYRDRLLDKLSPSFCGAKWYNATIWLGSAMTSSCHHPPAHSIKLEDVKNYFNSTTELGNYVYQNNLDFQNPIFTLNEKYNKSSFEKIKQYFK